MCAPPIQHCVSMLEIKPSAKVTLVGLLYVATCYTTHCHFFCVIKFSFLTVKSQKSKSVVARFVLLEITF